MYWTDAQRGIIESSKLDGSGRVVLIDERRSALSSNNSSVVRPHYYGIALDQNYLYYTDWARGSVHRYYPLTTSSCRTHDPLTFCDKTLLPYLMFTVNGRQIQKKTQKTQRMTTTCMYTEQILNIM